MNKNLRQYFYNVTLTTPVGIRYGYLELNVEQDLISGWLDILNHKSQISGQILKNGTCKLTGTLISLMQNFNYTATGCFNTHSIELLLMGNKNNQYILTGNATGRNKLWDI